jgi:hypothetical protein
MQEGIFCLFISVFVNKFLLSLLPTCLSNATAATSHERETHRARQGGGEMDKERPS